MRLIAITAPETVAEETATVNGLFQAGLEILHIRKPGYGLQEMRRLVEAIDPAFRQRVTLHSHHLLVEEFDLGGRHFPAAAREANVAGSGRRSTSCHEAAEIEELAGEYTYLFISPIFDSISKPGYQAAFDPKTLIAMGRHHLNLVALGGIDCCTLPSLPGNHWYGAAVLGAIWNLPTVEERIDSLCTLLHLAARREKQE